MVVIKIKPFCYKWANQCFKLKGCHYTVTIDYEFRLNNSMLLHNGRLPFSPRMKSVKWSNKGITTAQHGKTHINDRLTNYKITLCSNMIFYCLFYRSLLASPLFFYLKAFRRQLKCSLYCCALLDYKSL